jgi:hypothetical protein
MADAFNKFTKLGQGTLVGNWQEERELRELTGHGRNYPINHVPRVQGEPVYMRSRDGTDTRIHGTDHPLDTLNTFNYEYGKSTNPADNLSKIGRREQLLKSQLFEEISKEQQEKLQEEKRRSEQRLFETTSKSTHGWVEGDGNIGRRIMKDQNLRDVQMSDEEFATEHGFRRIQPISNIDELKREVEGQHLAVTLYTDCLNRQTVPISASKGVNPFARTCGFTQPNS